MNGNELQYQRYSDRSEQHVRELLKILRPYASSPEDLDIALELIAVELGTLQARMEAVEAIAKRLVVQTEQRNSRFALFGSNQFPIRSLERQLPLHSLETTDSGVEYAWTKLPEFELELPIHRDRPRYFRLWLHSVIVPEYFREVEVFVNDEEIPVRALAGIGNYVVQARVPASDDIGVSSIRVAIPDTHSPAEKGVNPDTRQLGLGIIGIDFSASPVSRWPRRPRLPSALQTGAT